METWFTSQDVTALLPLIVLVAGAFTVLLADALSKDARPSYALPFISAGTIGLAALAVFGAWTGPARVAAGGALMLGPYTTYVSLVILASAAIAFLYSIDYCRRIGIEVGEYYGLFLFATCGMLYLVAANDLVSLFIAFELMSLSIYALAGISRTDPRSGEGAAKYFILGSFSSAFLLYGLALLYGASGSIYLPDIHISIGSTPPNGLTMAGIALVMIGFAFKVGAVPFHAWVPDAYEGAPASVTGFMAVAVKAAAFAVFLRLLHATGLLAAASSQTATNILWVIAVATMVVGNFAAIAQTSIQRMLAYSGIAHSGYVLVGIVAATQDHTGQAAAGTLFYLASYAGMTIFMVSLIGIPPTAGFMGKLWVFRAAVQAGFTPLVVIAMLTSAVSVYYYLRVVVVMFMSEPAPVAATVPVSGGVSGRDLPRDLAAAPAAIGGASFGGSLAILLAVVVTMAVGMFPQAMLDHATRSVAALLGR